MSGSNLAVVVEQLPNIPEELADRPQWLVWKFISKPSDKKPRKVPFYVSGRPRSGGNGSDEDVAQLVTLDVAWNAVQSGDYSGLGFAFLPGDGLVGVDLDGSINDDGDLRADHKMILQAVRTYTERSPSGKGYHLIAKASQKFPHKKNHDKGVECFYGKGFFTFTANISNGRTQLDEAPDNLVEILGFDQLEKRGVQAKDTRSPRADSEYPETTIDDVQEMLRFISPDVGYDDWVKVGRILVDEFGGLQGGAAWDSWSSGGQDYPGANEIGSKIRSFQTAPGSSVASLGTIVHMAKSGGWVPPRRSSAPVSAPPAPPSEPALPPRDALRAEEVDYAGDGVEPEAPPLDAYDNEPPITPSDQTGGKSRGMRPPTFEELIHQFSLIYGTDTVWDGERRRIIKLSALREVVGKDSLRRWSESEARRIIEKVVFDPEWRYDRDLTENLYDGFHIERNTQLGSDPILQHIMWMCGNDLDVYQWILKWIAYPLQNPGAKMATSIINYGIEGTGKSFLWEVVVKAMYGRYGFTVGQAQLESAFTSWKSHKLFVVAEEVVSRAEKAHYKGQIKHMITGNTHVINEKHLPEREEDNLMNFVFLSNNTQPLELDYGDRRYLALFMGQTQPNTYYEQLGQWVKDGGVEAFYHYLMELDLGDFGPHSKPPMTEAKQNLINLSMPSPANFYQAWVNGDLPIAPGPAVNAELYEAYRLWCTKHGEYVFSHRKCTGEWQRFMKQVRSDIVHPEASSVKRTKRYWIPPAWNKDPSNLHDVGQACCGFHEDLRRWGKGEIV